MRRLPFQRTRGKRAQTLVEFSLVMPFFFLLLFGVIDFAQVYFYSGALQHALRETARYSSTGRVLTYYTNGYTSNEIVKVGGIPLSRYSTARAIFQSNCVLPVTATNLIMYSWPGTNSATETAPNHGPGEQSDMVRITASYYIGFITPYTAFSEGLIPKIERDPTKLMMLTSIYRNEPSSFFSNLAVANYDLIP